MIDLTSFNENQRKAIEWNEGPLLVLGGSGSGKTRVLAYRIAQVIDRTPKKTFRFLALTVTNKSAIEILDGLAKSPKFKNPN
jgi:DNA helicase-2/ATP-dependent DNA helicase PcrA